MYELGMDAVVIPQLTAELASFGATLSAFGAIWAALSGVLFLIIALLAADPPAADDAEPATSIEDLAQAA